MNNLTQLFRFIIPGGFFAIYYVILSPLFGFEINSTLEKYKDYSAIIIFLLPAIGYFASTFHHLIYNWLPFYRIRLEVYDSKQFENYQEEWADYNVRWRKQANKEKRYIEFHARNNSLTDMMHGSGSVLASLLLAVVVLITEALLNSHKWDWNLDKTILIFVLILLVGLHLISYLNLKRHTEKFVNKALAELEKPEE